MNSNPPPIRVPLNWFEFLQKNKPQTNSVSAGLLLMAVSGLHISYGIFTVDDTTIYNQSIIKSSWYFGVIIAGLAAHFLTDKWEKKFFYGIGAVACGVGSSMFFKPMSNYEEFLIFGRFVAGIGHGLVYMPLVIHCGENSVKELRGMLLSSINYLIIITATFFYFFTTINESSKLPMIFLAITGVAYSAIALIVVPIMLNESPIFLLRKNRNNEALVILIKLRSEQTESLEVRADYEDLRQLIKEDDARTSSNILKDKNLRPLLLVTLSKLLYSISFHFLFRLSTVISESIFKSDFINFWIPLVLLCTRMIFGMIPIFGMDKIGRKKLMTLSTSLCGITIIVLGIFIKSSESQYFWTFATFFLLFDIFSSLGIGMIPEVLSSEAFPITKKSLSITFANTIDTLFNMILIIGTPQVLGESEIFFILLGFGVLLILGGGFFYYQLPETKQMSLRQSRDALRGRTYNLLSQVQLSD